MERLNKIYDSNALIVVETQEDLLSNNKKMLSDINAFIMEYSKYAEQIDKSNQFKKTFQSWWERFLLESQKEQFFIPIKEENILFTATLIKKAYKEEYLYKHNVKASLLEFDKEDRKGKRAQREENALNNNISSLFVISLAEQYRRRTNSITLMIQSHDYDLVLFLN